MCIRNTESIDLSLLLSQCITVMYHMKFNTSYVDGQEAKELAKKSGHKVVHVTAEKGQS